MKRPCDDTHKNKYIKHGRSIGIEKHNIRLMN